MTVEVSTLVLGRFRYGRLKEAADAAVARTLMLWVLNVCKGVEVEVDGQICSVEPGDADWQQNGDSVLRPRRVGWRGTLLTRSSWRS